MYRENTNTQFSFREHKTKQFELKRLFIGIEDADLDQLIVLSGFRNSSSSFLVITP
jgi:hypothetical protein